MQTTVLLIEQKAYRVSFRKHEARDSVGYNILLLPEGKVVGWARRHKNRWMGRNVNGTFFVASRAKAAEVMVREHLRGGALSARNIQAL